MPVQPIRSDADFDAARTTSQSQPVVLFKHSTRCPVSTWAKREFDAFAKKATGIGLYQVLVVEDRPTSLGIAKTTGVRHESPQALLLVNGEVAWHTSHNGITARALQDAVARVTA